MTRCEVMSECVSQIMFRRCWLAGKPRPRTFDFHAQAVLDCMKMKRGHFGPIGMLNERLSLRVNASEQGPETATLQFQSPMSACHCATQKNSNWKSKAQVSQELREQLCVRRSLGTVPLRARRPIPCGSVRLACRGTVPQCVVISLEQTVDGVGGCLQVAEVFGVQVIQKAACLIA